MQIYYELRVYRIKKSCISLYEIYLNCFGARYCARAQYRVQSVVIQKMFLYGRITCRRLVMVMRTAFTASRLVW